MSSHASTRITSTLYPQDSYNPYTPEGEPEKALGAEIPRPDKYPERRPSGALNFYRSISWILGFRDKYSLLNCFVWGGALVGFCLARSVTMNPGTIAAQLIPGEWFWLKAPMYKINLFIHIYLTTLGGLGAVLQFFPAIRRRAVILHRLNGYGVSFCLIVGNICGSIIARRSIGGELNVQSGYYTLGIMVVFAGLMGLYNVKKDTRRHRKWMLRMSSHTTPFSKSFINPNPRHGGVLRSGYLCAPHYARRPRDHHNNWHLLLGMSLCIACRPRRKLNE